VKVCLFTKAEEVELRLLYQVFAVVAKVLCLYQRTNMTGFRNCNTNLSHLVAVETVVFSINADDQHVLGELVGNITSLGDISVTAGLSINSVEPKTMTEDLEVVVIVLVEESFQLTEWCRRHDDRKRTGRIRSNCQNVSLATTHLSAWFSCWNVDGSKLCCGQS
jgi:hypothetical protein